MRPPPVLYAASGFVCEEARSKGAFACEVLWTGGEGGTECAGGARGRTWGRTWKRARGRARGGVAGGAHSTMIASGLAIEVRIATAAEATARVIAAADKRFVAPFYNSYTCEHVQGTLCTRAHELSHTILVTQSRAATQPSTFTQCLSLFS